MQCRAGTARKEFNLFLDVPSACRLREIDKLMVADNLLNSRSYKAENQHEGISTWSRF